MLFSSKICAAAALFVSQVLANKESTECYTVMTSKKPNRPPPTQYQTHYTPCTTQSKYTVAKTVTPKITKTTTKTSYTTITNPNKDTSTVIETVTSGTTTVTTSTSTATATTTTTGISTSNVPAPAGFTPVLSSLPGSSFTGSDDLESDIGARSPEKLSKRNAPQAYPYKGKSYPKQVTCHKYTSDKKKCATKKVTVTKTSTAKASTYYSTKKVVKTSTECPKAKATVTTKTTIITTSTSTAQATTTTTSTSTSFVSTTTVYAACASNLANRVNGEVIVYGQPLPEDRVPVAGRIRAANSLECCNIAFRSRPASDPFASLQLFYFDRRPDPSNPGAITGFCTIGASRDGVCPATQSGNLFEVKNESQFFADPEDDIPADPETDPVSNPTVGNGPCGLVVGPQAA